MIERVALFLADHLSFRITERDDGQNVVPVGQPELLSHVLQTCETRPVRADAVAPTHQHHRLDGAARVGDARLAVLLISNDYRCGGVRCVRPVRTSDPSLRSASRLRTSTKCQGWRLAALAVRCAASTIRLIASSGTSLS